MSNRRRSFVVLTLLLGAMLALPRPGGFFGASAGAQTVAAEVVGANLSAATSPAATSPAATSPAATSPAATSPAATSPAATSPAATSPAATSPAATSPAATSPAATSPAAEHCEDTAINLLSYEQSTVESSIEEWVGTNATLTQEDTDAVDGAHSLGVSAEADGDASATAAGAEVEPGTRYAAQALALSADRHPGVDQVGASIVWYDSEGGVIETSEGSPVTLAEAANRDWVGVWAVGRAPEGAATAGVAVTVFEAPADEVYLVDAAMLEAGRAASPWVAGSSGVAPDCDDDGNGNGDNGGGNNGGNGGNNNGGNNNGGNNNGGNNNGGNNNGGNNNGGNGGNNGGNNNGGHNKGGDKDAKHDRRRDAKKGDGHGRGVGPEGARRKQSPSKRDGRDGGTSGDDRQDGGGSDGLTPGASGNAPKKGDAASSGTVPPSSIASSNYEFAGSYSSNALMSRALKLRSLGWSTGDVATEIFAPFIIGGEAGWIDTWGAPRSGGRSHEGQDVFCNYGAPVLASEDGVVEFDEGGLGGRVARLLRPDGSYWYYAHLAEWNTDQFSSGDGVEVGDIIGFCGNTGNALTTPPHVHFGFYGADGVAQNPMAKLVEWLHTAERRSLGYVSKVQVRRVQKVEAITSARRFGDAFTPAPTKRADQQELYAYLLDGAKGMPLSMLQTMLIEGVEIPAAGAEPLNPKLHYFEAWLNGQTFPALLQGVDQAP